MTISFVRPKKNFSFLVRATSDSADYVTPRSQVPRSSALVRSNTSVPPSHKCSFLTLVWGDNTSISLCSPRPHTTKMLASLALLVVFVLVFLHFSSFSFLKFLKITEKRSQHAKIEVPKVQWPVNPPENEVLKLFFSQF